MGYGSQHSERSSQPLEDYNDGMNGDAGGDGYGDDFFGDSQGMGLGLGQAGTFKCPHCDKSVGSFFCARGPVHRCSQLTIRTLRSYDSTLGNTPGPSGGDIYRTNTISL